MGAEAGEECEFLAARHHVDRVDLDDAHRVDGAAQMSLVDAAARSCPVESLAGEREMAGVGGADRCAGEGAGVQGTGFALLVVRR